jgi:hypothetical protein
VGPVLWLLESGAVAQLGERLICIQEVVGSTPIGSIPGDRSRESGFRSQAVPSDGVEWRRYWLSDLGGGERGPVSWLLVPVSRVLDNVKRVLAAGEAPVAP